MFKGKYCNSNICSHMLKGKYCNVYKYYMLSYAKRKSIIMSTRTICFHMLEGKPLIETEAGRSP